MSSDYPTPGGSARDNAQSRYDALKAHLDTRHAGQVTIPDRASIEELQEAHQLAHERIE